MSSIRTRLLIGLLLGTFFCTLAAALLLYTLADHEADEQSDQRLRQVAWAMPLQPTAGLRLPEESDPEDRFLVQIRDGEDAIRFTTDAAIALPRMPSAGYHTISYGGERWRVYADVRARQQIQTAQPIAMRRRVAAHMALRIAPPLLLLLPAMAVLIWVVVGRALLPLQRLTQAVRGRTPNALQPLEDAQLPPELRPIVMALNGLLRKVDGAMSAQRTFVADAAHELRSPLTALKLQLQLAERADSEAPRAASFRKLHERLDRSTHLVQQLLTLARQEQPNSPARTPINLLALARQVAADQALYAESRGIDLGVANAASDSSGLWVLAQADGMSVLLSNLVDNALRYTGPGGRVDISTGVEQGRIYLRVSDNGPGVPEAERARLFDRFYRLDGNTVPGCGLGLSIVKSVADAHGAQILLDSGADGAGLVVTLLLETTLA